VTRPIWGLVLAFLLPRAAASSGAAGGQAPAAVEHVPAAAFTRQEPLVLRVTAKERPEWLIAFWRAEGDEEFASATFEPGEKGLWLAKIDTASFAAKTVEYYLVFKSSGRVAYLPAGGRRGI